MSARVPRISFVIPVRNQADQLRLALRAIREGLLPAADVEIVVVDNGSLDASAQVARDGGATVLTVHDVGVSALRNRGADESDADVVAFCDADNLIVPGWAEVALELLQDPSVGAVGAPCVPPDDATWVQEVYDGLRDHDPGMHDVRWLGAANLAIRRNVFEQLKGFDESLETCEDVDLCSRLVRAGWRLLADSRLESAHLGDPETLEQLFRGELWRGRDNLKVSLRGSLTWRDLPSIVIPVVDLGFLALAVLGLVTVSAKGLAAAGAAVLGFSALAGLRALAMILRSRRLSPRHAPQAFAVACTYDLARALALVWHIGHHRNPDR